MRKSKDRKHIKSSILKNTKAKKTADSRKRREKNKIVRDTMENEAPNLNIEVINGVVHTKYVEKVVMKTECDYEPAEFEEAVLEYQVIMDKEGKIGKGEPYGELYQVGKNIDKQIEKERLHPFKMLKKRIKQAITG